MKRWIALLSLALSVSAAVPALELKDGRIKLVVDERSGRFALAHQRPAERGVRARVGYELERAARVRFRGGEVAQRPEGEAHH